MEILNICSKWKLIPESEILNIVRIGNEFRNQECNRKRIVRISIGRGPLDEGPAQSQAIAQRAARTNARLDQAQRKARPSQGRAHARAQQHGPSAVRLTWAARLARVHGSCNVCAGILILLEFVQRLNPNPNRLILLFRVLIRF